jgi:protein ImuB
VERLIAVWCPTLLHQGEMGEEARVFARVVTTVHEFCPWVDAVRLGVCVLPSRGPSRFFGGESAVLDELTAALGKVVTDAGNAGAGNAGVCVGVADG